MIEADISRLAQQGRSSYDRDNNNQSNLTYSPPKSPAEVSKTVPNVPRFRYMPTGVPVSRSNPSRNPPQNYYESEDSDEFDSDDSGENERGGRYGSKNVGGFHESLRLATFRGGSESEEVRTNGSKNTNICGSYNAKRCRFRDKYSSGFTPHSF